MTDAVYHEAEARRLRAVVESQRCDIDYQREVIESLRREIAALRGEPDSATAAPSYANHVWCSWTGWSGPYHLVAYEWQPYPQSNTPYGVDALPEIWVPAKRALCGANYTGRAYTWPKASEVCVECVSRANDK